MYAGSFRAGAILSRVMTGDDRAEAPAGDAPATGSSAPGSGRRRASDLGWGKILVLLAWGFVVLAFAAGGLADVTNLWWLVLVFGAAVPVTFVALQRGAYNRGRVPTRTGEGKLLEALREHGELTPASAAMLTRLTVEEASGILESLARKGHLESRARDGSILYALRERDRMTLGGPAGPDATAGKRSATGEANPLSLPDPLSARELEVLRLMALGRTNAEISRELFVAVGTVKAHANNIYRKLDANNRSEAVSKAGRLGLLR